MKILITGPQGSGKTTHAKILAEKLKVCFIKAGDLVREKALEDNKEGKKLKEALEKGGLADDKIVANLVEVKLEKSHCRDNFVMDGYPRRLAQLKVFDPKFDKVFYLDLPDELATKRMLKRGRFDDVPNLIKERLRLYHQLTGQVLGYYRGMGILIKIDAAGTIKKVSEKIASYVNR